MIVDPSIFVNLKTSSITQHYTIGAQIGEGKLAKYNLKGAYGKVNMCVHLKTNITRAMKSLKKSLVLKEDEDKLFSEMNLLKGLDHPNIVRLYELY